MKKKQPKWAKNIEKNPNIVSIVKMFFFDRFQESGKSQDRAETKLSKFREKLKEKLVKKNLVLLTEEEENDFDSYCSRFYIDLSKRPDLQSEESLSNLFKKVDEMKYMGEESFSG